MFEQLHRRAFLTQHSGHVGLLALASLLGKIGRLVGCRARQQVIKPRAKSVICLFQNGGPSQWTV